MSAAEEPIIVSCDDGSEDFDSDDEQKPPSDDEQDAASKAASASSASGGRAHADVYKHIKKRPNGMFECTPCHNKNEKQVWRNRSTSNFCKHLIKHHSAIYTPYLLPMRNTLRNRVIQQWTDEKNHACVTIEDECGTRCSGTTSDMWTSAAKRGYMVVTLHYIDDKWCMRSVIIAFKRVLYPHSGERLASHFVNAVASSAAEDNDIAVVGYARTVFQLRCIAHVLQLAVQHGLKSCPMMDNAIGRFRELMKKIVDSPKLLESLASICSSLKIAQRTPELDCETRWNSTWAMLNSVLMLKKPLEELLHRCNHL
ncbi:hypothetical protein MARPO_0016s0138 [Marchantia polymorpha]|uniref:BED-type domain-containing protein n=1 Tax=Marchantia polymorpha TaxID=3197 RepID=A0A2R6XGA2_MARPO|nr:hypothetical protein MARPO_0016s0138 [Marchantia polymorpha]|eukprot:PTQ45089.1 hypothetical protein MARPO_0016s0138 [Marchantia polymorpha]